MLLNLKARPLHIACFDHTENCKAQTWLLACHSSFLPVEPPCQIHEENVCIKAEAKMEGGKIAHKNVIFFKKAQKYTTNLKLVEETHHTWIVVLALGRWKQGSQEFKASPG